MYKLLIPALVAVLVLAACGASDAEEVADATTSVDTAGPTTPAPTTQASTPSATVAEEVDQPSADEAAESDDRDSEGYVAGMVAAIEAACAGTYGHTSDPPVGELWDSGLLWRSWVPGWPEEADPLFVMFNDLYGADRDENRDVVIYQAGLCDQPADELVAALNLDEFYECRALKTTIGTDVLDVADYCGSVSAADRDAAANNTAVPAEDEEVVADTSPTPNTNVPDDSGSGGITWVPFGSCPPPGDLEEFGATESGVEPLGPSPDAANGKSFVRYTCWYDKGGTSVSILVSFTDQDTGENLADLSAEDRANFEDFESMGIFTTQVEPGLIEIRSSDDCSWLGPYVAVQDARDCEQAEQIYRFLTMAN